MILLNCIAALLFLMLIAIPVFVCWVDKDREKRLKNAPLHSIKAVYDGRDQINHHYNSEYKTFWNIEDYDQIEIEIDDQDLYEKCRKLKDGDKAEMTIKILKEKDENDEILPISISANKIGWINEDAT